MGTLDDTVWTIDWNPDFADDGKLKQEVLNCFKDKRVLRVIKSFVERSKKEAEGGFETEHIVWLDGSQRYALFVRAWFETTEEKTFIVIEENDLGDVGFLLLAGQDCASYADEKVLRVEYNEKFKDPGSMGISR
ncbi:MAG TPA: hypothetical protein VM681_11335 [Candidatus Thermoplasmatota archaeon]|nr:hypothetical protein [Candidatus Thermoplasmatota archaeon]